MDNKTKVACPNCGAEFVIPEHTHMAFGVVIGQDSNLGVIHPEVTGQFTRSQREDINHKPTTSNPKNMKAEAKIEALRKAGVNVDNLFSMKGVNGQETIGRLENGLFTIVDDNDPIFDAITKGGAINNPKLYRRWVMAQVFHMLATGDFIKALQRKGYAYQWTMLIEELRVQAKMVENDPYNFRERNLYFDRDRVYKIAQDYLDKLVEHVKELPRKRCKGVPYVTLRGRNIFESDLNTKLYKSFRHQICNILGAKTPIALYQATVDFYKLVRATWINYDIPMSLDFKDSYKGAGAFFTMKNMILFHGCRFRNERGRFMSQHNSENLLYAKAEEYKTEGWRLFGLMKKLIADNGVNLQKKMAEWRKA